MYRVANGMGATKAIKPCAAVLKKQVSSESFDLDSSSDTGQTNLRHCNSLQVKGSMTASAAKRRGDLDLVQEEKKGMGSTEQPRGRVVVIRGSSQKRYSTPGQAAPQFKPMFHSKKVSVLPPAQEVPIPTMRRSNLIMSKQHSRMSDSNAKVGPILNVQCIKIPCQEPKSSTRSPAAETRRSRDVDKNPYEL